jgi:hypothetical protein
VPFIDKKLRFAAKRTANSCKTQCYLLQNARLNATKRMVKCYKTRGGMHKTGRKIYILCLLVMQNNGIFRQKVA